MDLKIKSPRIEIVATLALPKSSYLPNLDFQGFQVSFNKHLTASASSLHVNAPSGKIENKSKTFHVINSTDLELGAGDVSGYWSLSRKSFDIDIRAGFINIDVFPLGATTEEYDMNLKTEVRAGETKIVIHSPDSGSQFPRKMTSKHIGGAGNFKLEYPSIWAGTVSVDGNSRGKVEIVGKDVEVTSEKDGRIRKAKVGQGESEMSLELGAGCIEVEFD